MTDEQQAFLKNYRDCDGVVNLLITIVLDDGVFRPGIVDFCVLSGKEQFFPCFVRFLRCGVSVVRDDLHVKTHLLVEFIRTELAK